MKTNLTCLLLFCWFGTLTAQQSVVVQNGQLRAHFSSRGLANNFSEEGPLLSYFDVSDQAYKPLAFAAALWLGSQSPDGALSLNARTYGNGAVQTSGLLPKVFQVSGDQILAHRADYQDDGQIDIPLPDIYGWPAHGNPYFSDYHDGLALPDLSPEMLAPFRDVDGNGAYNPSAGDFPVLAEASCADFEGLDILPTQMNWCLYEVEAPHSEPAYLVQANLFYFRCQENNALNNTLFLKHKVLKAQEAPGADHYWSVWADLELGNGLDDYVGSFPERELAFIYNADNEDENASPFLGFGENPPVFGLKVLAGPNEAPEQPLRLSSLMHYFNGSSGNFPSATSDPTNLQEFFNYMTGKWRDGQPLTEGGLGYGGEQAANFAFPGLPAQEGIWTEHGNSNPLGDRRVLLNFGPFSDYVEGDTKTLHTAFIYSDNGSGHLNQAEALQMRSDSIQAFFYNCYNPEGSGFSPCNLTLTGTDTRVTARPKIKAFPNPTTGQLQVEANIPIETMEVLDSQGNTVYRGATPDRIDFSHLPKGIYILRVQAAGQLAHQKIVHQ